MDDQVSSRWVMRARWIIAGMVILALIGIFSRQDDSTETAHPLGMEEWVYSDQILTGHLSGPGIPSLIVSYSLVDGYAVFEGDILLHTPHPLERGTGIRNTAWDYRWPDGIIPYEIDSRLPNPSRVQQAIAHWESITPIRFVQRTAQHAHYVYFKDGFGCASYVGMIGGRQDILLAAGCSVGATIHEIGHAVGLWHEQSRADRDQYVQINFENILPGTEHNFLKHVSDGIDIGPYDYDSIMHYPRWAFSRNGRDTIVPLQDRVIGQRQTLSPGDIAAVLALYEGVITDER
ncbi:MAG: M12 family metallopeptidase [Anaerolineae bacterium]|jgi:astacin|nr:M12 family metallopeptidase [Anaerolineae bacterium]